MGLLLTDFPECVKMMTDDFAWENFLPSHVPFGGRYEGAAGLQEYVAQLSESWVIGELVFHDFVFDPETRILAAPGVEQNGSSVATRRTCDMPFVWEFRFSTDGKLRYVREYNDTAAIGATFDV
jgi:ketosteroid isomerase-like protein